MMNILGKSFVFGRTDNTILGSVRLDNNGVIFSHQKNFNESYWNINNNNLEFLNGNKHLTTKFSFNNDKWIGDYYENNKISYKHHFINEFKPSWYGRKYAGKKLIYIIAIGDFYNAMAKMLINSLRKLGKYDGDILVFCNNKSLYGINDIKIINVERDFKPKISPKIILGKDINCDNYDRILFLDCDILCFKEINGLFSGEGFNFSEHCLDNKGQVSALNEHEKKLACSSMCINGGTFCHDGNKFNNFMNECYEILKNGDHRIFRGLWMSEENAFTKMVHNNKNIASGYSMYDINFSWIRHSSESCILHHYMSDLKGMISDYFKYF